MEVTKSFNVVITTTRVETDVAPNTNVIKGGVSTGFAPNLGHESGKIFAENNLIRSLGIPITTTGVLGPPKIVFTNSIMIIHVNKIANQPSITIIVT